MTSIYDFRDYKCYLQALCRERGLRSGFKSGLARASQCNSAYISSILGGKAHFSLEQAERVCAYLELSHDETHFFLLLIQLARAGTEPLRSYFQQQIDRLLEQKLDVQRRLGARERLSKSDQARYYSSWTYAAVHVALSVPRLARSVESLAAYLELPVPTVKAIVDFLVETGLAEATDQGYKIGPKHIHLSQRSENILRHHTNWRLRVLRGLEKESRHGLNYSSAVTLSRADALKVREVLLEAIKNSVDVIMKSPEEEVYTLAVDFIPLGESPSR